LGRNRTNKLRVDALFAMSDADFRGPDIDLHYAVARFFAQWLDARRALCFSTAAGVTDTSTTERA
jgi:hypothetical protein